MSLFAIIITGFCVVIVGYIALLLALYLLWDDGKVTELLHGFNQEENVVYMMNRLVDEHREAGCKNPEICGGAPTVENHEERLGGMSYSVSVKDRFSVECEKRKAIYERCKAIVQKELGE